MAKNIKDMSTVQLINSQQLIQHASTEMYGFFTHVEKEWKTKKVSTSYKEKLEQNLHNRIMKNNEVVDKIDKELCRRIESEFPGVTSTQIMKVIVPNFEQEQKDFAKPLKEEKPKGKTLDLNVSREKKV